MNEIKNQRKRERKKDPMKERERKMNKLTKI